jgi:hypothetical protein
MTNNPQTPAGLLQRAGDCLKQMRSHTAEIIHHGYTATVLALGQPMDYQCSLRSLSIKQAVELAGHSREERAVEE